LTTRPAAEHHATYQIKQNMFQLRCSWPLQL